MAADLLVVGLGNPGGAYADTRHNVGRWAVDELVRRHDARLCRARREKSLVAELTLAGREVAVAVPVTYMNESGRAVGPMVRRYGIRDMSRLVVVHDELDLPVGRIRVKAGGGLAGHRGLKSIHAHLRSHAFTRVRIGIGRPDRTSVAGRNSEAEDAARAGRVSRSDRVGGSGRGAGARESVVEHVLGRPGKAERAELSQATARAADAVECLSEDGLETTMNRFNAS